MFVYNKFEQIDRFFQPGTPSNEIHFYNRLTHYGEKMNKGKNGKNILCVNNF